MIVAMVGTEWLFGPVGIELRESLAIAGGFPIVLALPDLLQGEYITLGVPRAQELDDTHLRVWEIGFYGEDDWHVNKHLTLNLGLRYDVYTPFTEIQNRIATWDPATESLLVAGRNCVSNTAGIQTDYHGVEPRVGFDAQTQIRNDLVVRGGYGISFVPPLTQVVQLVETTSIPPFITQRSLVQIQPPQPSEFAVDPV
ncbi:MAG TPA: TonB-dependent receptor [Terracidiphilus sp.]|jgi:outer membrane receptor protein involved in Fe transport